MHNNVVSLIQEILQTGLGTSLQAVYLLGPLTTVDEVELTVANLLAVVADDAPLHDLRAVFEPAWQKYSPSWPQSPVVVPRHRLERHFQLNPNSAYRREQGYHLLYGQDLLADLPLVEDDPLERLAHHAHSAMLLSALLAPEMLLPEVLPTCAFQLRHLFWEVTGEVAPTAATAVALLARIQQEIETKLADLSPPLQIDEGSAESDEDAPPLLPNLQAVYERTSELVLLLPEPLAGQLEKIDWQDVSQRLDDEYEQLNVTTTAQLRLIMRYVTPAHYALQHYALAWGTDAFVGLDSSPQQLFYAIAQFTHTLQTRLFPHVYLTADDEGVHNAIHDFQNDLHKINLQNELLYRLEGIPYATPPNPLPDRTTPSPQRIDAIFAEADWWTEHYLSLMRQAIPQ